MVDCRMHFLAGLDYPSALLTERIPTRACPSMPIGAYQVLAIDDIEPCMSGLQSYPTRECIQKAIEGLRLTATPYT
jgi:hypothetical protein